MIGQKNLLKHIDTMILSHCFPRFSIIVGEEGKEITELTEYVANQFNYIIFHLVDAKIDSVREVIYESYKIQRPIIYVLHYADDMSIPAKNALLKVTEEPPNNAYFIMLLEDLNNTLDTIRSRATIFTMEPYSKKELEKYVQEQYNECKALYTDLCETPGQIDILHNMKPDSFYEYVSKVVDNIASVSGANSFKIAEKVALKDEPEKYNLKMFWKACCKFFYDKAKVEDYICNMRAMQQTSEVIKKLSIRGVNKQMLFDEWILNVRKELMV